MLTMRLFVPTDIPEVTRIVKSSLGEDYPPSLYLTVHNIWREGFIVLQEDGRMVGFVAAVPSGDRVARVLMLAVDPASRRKSYGRTLMQELYSNCLAKGLDTVVLEVRKSNEAAISFYTRQGFAIYGEISRFYSNGEDAYKMMKVLRS
ncbi:MAG: N-acetyltransferase [Thermoplasmata archaeon]